MDVGIRSSHPRTLVERMERVVVCAIVAASLLMLFGPVKQVHAATLLQATWDTGSNYGEQNMLAFPLRNITGYSGSGSPQANRVSSGAQGITAYSGDGYLQVAGSDTSSSTNSYAYHRIYDNVNIVVTSGMRLSYEVYHYAHDPASRHMAFDFIYSLEIELSMLFFGFLMRSLLQYL